MLCLLPVIASPRAGDPLSYQGQEICPCTNSFIYLPDLLLFVQGMREPRQSHHLTRAEKPWSQGGNRLKLKQMLWWEQLPERNSGRESGRDNETPRDLEVSFPRSRGVSSLELELAAVVRISLPFSLLLLFPRFPPTGLKGWRRKWHLEQESRCQCRTGAAVVLEMQLAELSCCLQQRPRAW